MTKNTNLKCFLSTSNANYYHILKGILSELNIQTIDFTSYNPGNDINTSVKEQIKDSDFIIAVVSGDYQNTIFETGIARGIGKPIFVIVDKDTDV